MARNSTIERSALARLLGTSALCSSLLCGGAALAQPAPNTLPTGGAVTAGASTIAQSGAAMTITQTSARSAINCQGYSIGATARVQYVQPNAHSVSCRRLGPTVGAGSAGALRWPLGGAMSVPETTMVPERP